MQIQRPNWYTWALWAIPASTWLLLTLVFTVGNQPAMKTLVESQDTAKIEEIENYLQERGIVYKREGQSRIEIDANEFNRVNSVLQAKNLIGFNSGVQQNSSSK